MTERPEPIHLRTKVHHPYRGRTVLEFLCERFRYLPRELWETRIETGKIRLNGRTAGAEDVVDTDDEIEYTIEIIEPTVDFAYDIIYTDDDILVVSKSGNIPVHASGKFIRNTLIARLRDDLGKDLNLAHRLDRETSGLVILTRNVEAARAISAAFAGGAVSKTYLAIVRGCPSDVAFEIDAPLGRIGKQHPIPRSIIDRRNGKAARTSVRVIERLQGEQEFSVVEARPHTGRTNQIRVHLESTGHPIIGDKTYGLPATLLRKLVEDPESPEVLAHLVLPRHALHHASIAFEHPRTGERLELIAPLPADIADFIDAHRLLTKDPASQ
ncbi:RluA family pseudouridine synthase [bacterium]|nr:RluA family pseudouridine synthase [bacterium]